MSRRLATTDVYYAIADPTRRRLLDLLGDGALSVNSLAAHFEFTLSAISQHLRLLREAGLVSVRRAGRERWYELNAAPLQEVSDWIGHYERFWKEKLAALEKHLEQSP